MWGCRASSDHNMLSLSGALQQPGRNHSERGDGEQDMIKRSGSFLKSKRRIKQSLQNRREMVDITRSDFYFAGVKQEPTLPVDT